MSKGRLLFWACLFGGLAAYAGMSALMLGGPGPQLHRADCILVPGAWVAPDGTCGPALRARIETAVELYRQGWAPVLLLTGGPGASGPVEAEAARALAVQLGVPPQACYVETRSHNTFQNLYYAREVMRQQGWSSCLIVTDPFHCRRCLWIARDLGVRAWAAPAAGTSGVTRVASFWWHTARECLSWARYAALRLLGGEKPPSEDLRVRR